MSKLPEVDIKRKKLEVIPRIKFNHRGQVAMALPLEEDEEASSDEVASLSRQFFMTMDEAPFLDKKYVIFGTIRGDTVFNALRIGKTETVGETGELADKDNGPKIMSVRIVEHIFDDLVATKEELVPWKKTIEKTKGGDADALKKRRKKRKGKRDLNVLSFGGEMEDMDEGLEISGGMQSIHDLGGKGGSVDKTIANGSKQESKDEKLKSKKRRMAGLVETADGSDTAEPNVGTREDPGVAAMRKNEPDTQLRDEKDAAARASITGVASANMGPQKTSAPITSSRDTLPAAGAAPGMSAVEARRLKYLNKRNSAQGTRKASKQRDDDTMLKLNQFKTKMFQVKGVKEEGIKSNGHATDNSLAARMAKQLESEDRDGDKEKYAPVYAGQILEEDDGDVSGSTKWLKSTFRCKRHIDHDSKDQAMGRDGRKADDYEVVDEKKRKNTSQRSSDRHHR